MRITAAVMHKTDETRTSRRFELEEVELVEPCDTGTTIKPIPRMSR